MNALRVKLFLPILACLAIWADISAAQAPSGDPRCTRICVAIIQAVGDEVKEQISMDCIQATGVCTAQGHFQTINERMPVTLEGQLAGETFTLKIQNEEANFAPAEQDALVIPLAAGAPQHVAQFVVYRRADMNSSDPLAVTVMVQRLVDQ